MVIMNPFCLYKKSFYVLLLFSLKTNICLSFDINNQQRIQKCCGPNEQLTSYFTCARVTDKSIYSYDYDKDLSVDDQYPWWLQNNVFLSAEDSLPISFSERNFSELFEIDYGKIPCTLENDADLKLFLNDNTLYIYDNGSLLMLSNGVNRTLPSHSYCVDRLAGSDELLPVHVAFICPCNYLKCFRKCCYSDFVLTYSESDENWMCARAENVSWKSHLWKFDKDGDFYQVHKYPACHPERSYFAVNIEEYSDVSTNFNILSDGRLEYNGEIYSEHSYCGEITIFPSGKSIPNILACRKIDITVTYENLIYGSLYLFGSIFLFLTLAVFAAFPELRRKVHAYNLIAHVSCLLVGYVVHCFLSLGINLVRDSALCHFIGMLLQFSFLASFFWMNVMCIDISLAFSQLKPLQSMRGKSEKKKFVYYSLYVWGTTSLITVITLTAEYTSFLPSAYKPKFGERSCWFQYKIPTAIYFYFPMTILFIVNICLFLNTSIKIFNAHRDVAALTQGTVRLHEGRRNLKGRNRFVLYFKLFCLMGILWILEIVDEFFVESPYITIVIDSVNLLRSFFIFVIFCWKIKVLKLFKAKILKTSESNHRSSSKQSNSFKTSTRNGSMQLSHISSTSQIADLKA